MEKNYHGSCHCQRVRYQADIDLSKGSIRCNCRYCMKTRNWNSRIQPDKFRLLAGEASCSDYQQRPDGVHNIFCKHCGTHLYYYGDIAEMGGAFLAVRLNTLDDASTDELMSGTITCCDGLHNNWWQAPADIRAL